MAEEITEELGNPTTPATDTSGTPTAEQKQKDFENKAGVIDESVLLDDSKVINSEGLSNTGAGAKAAKGTQYSWDKKATEKADLQYQKDVLDEKQKLLQNRQQIQENAAKYQTETDMNKYQENQTIDKLGWTGGYVLDSIRQQDYLKQSTQAQLYGAMELQKYGYSTSLAAARLAYDMNQQDYALEYYNQAQSVAMQEGQLLGKYMSAEAKEMLDNYNTAKSKIDSGNYTEDDERIFKATEQWFERNQVSKEGIRTLAAIESYRENYKALMEDRWAKYQSILETTKEGLASGEVIMYDENGNPLYDGTQIKTFNLNTASGDEIKKYLEECDYNSNALSTVKSWLQQTIFDTVSQNAQKDSDGNPVAIKSTIEEAVSSALNSKISKLDPTNENIHSLLTNLDYGSLADFGIDKITVKYNEGTQQFDVTAKISGDIEIDEETAKLYNGTYNYTVQQTYKDGGYNLSSVISVSGLEGNVNKEEFFDATVNGNKYTSLRLTNEVVGEGTDFAKVLQKSAGTSFANGCLVGFKDDMYMYSSKEQGWIKVNKNYKSGSNGNNYAALLAAVTQTAADNNANPSTEKKQILMIADSGVQGYKVNDPTTLSNALAEYNKSHKTATTGILLSYKNQTYYLSKGTYFRLEDVPLYLQKKVIQID